VSKKYHYNAALKTLSLNTKYKFRKSPFSQHPKNTNSKKKLFLGQVIKFLKTGTANKYLRYINYTPSFFHSSSVSQIPSVKTIALPLKLKTEFLEFIKKRSRRRTSVIYSDSQNLTLLKTFLIPENKIKLITSFHE